MKKIEMIYTNMIFLYILYHLFIIIVISIPKKERRQTYTKLFSRPSLSDNLSNIITIIVISGSSTIMTIVIMTIVIVMMMMIVVIAIVAHVISNIDTSEDKVCMTHLIWNIGGDCRG